MTSRKPASPLALGSLILAAASLMAAPLAPAASPAPPAGSAAAGAAAGSSPAMKMPAQIPGPKLAGSKWEWTKLYNDDESVLTVKEPTRYVVEFLENGKLSLQADCNKGMGAWSGVSPSLKIEATASTRMACPAGSLGDRFLKLLSLAESIESDGRKLSIVLKPREGVMRFRRAGSGHAAKSPKGVPATPKATKE